jgi:OOP family OmpA-OmpF porin
MTPMHGQRSPAARARTPAMLCSLACALGMALAPSTRAHAQRAVELERFNPALDADGFLGVQGTRTPGKDRMSLALFGGYSSTTLQVRPIGGGEVDLVKRRSSGVLSGELGLGSAVALGLSMPLVLQQSGERLATGDPHLPAFALGDPALHVRYRVIGDAADTPEQRRDGPGLALQFGSELPAGDTDAYAGEGVVRVHGQLLADMHLLGAGIGGSVGFRHRFEGRRVYGARLRDELTFGAALKLPIPPLYPLAGLVEVRGATAFRSRATTAIEGEFGLLYALTSKLTLVAAVGTGLSGGIGTPAFRAIAGLWYAPGDFDADHDGVPDSRDACPFLAEDRDGYRDDDGCPDPDNDNDLVPDADDLCPNEAALEDRDADEDGCTDKP